jgi:hypothetical protein
MSTPDSRRLSLLAWVSTSAGGRTSDNQVPDIPRCRAIPNFPIVPLMPGGKFDDERGAIPS